MSAWADDVTPTLAHAAAKLTLWDRITEAVRGIEASPDVRQVIVSESRGEIVVVGSDYCHIGFRVIA